MDEAKEILSPLIKTEGSNLNSIEWLPAGIFIALKT